MAIGELKLNIRISMPSEEDMRLTAKIIEDEMSHLTLNAKNAFDYVNEIQLRLAKMITVSVSDYERHPTLTGITSGK